MRARGQLVWTQEASIQRAGQEEDRGTRTPAQPDADQASTRCLSSVRAGV